MIPRRMRYPFLLLLIAVWIGLPLSFGASAFAVGITGALGMIAAFWLGLEAGR
jgi:hypothetical protein